MGEVIRPERLTRKRRAPPIPDITPRPPEPPLPSPTPMSLYNELAEVRSELEKIKRVLKKHGIFVD